MSTEIEIKLNPALRVNGNVKIWEEGGEICVEAPKSFDMIEIPIDMAEEYAAGILAIVELSKERL